jgi:hypothetical protein
MPVTFASVPKCAQCLRYPNVRCAQFHLLMAGMGGREGAQSEAELRELAGASTGLANAEQLAAAYAELETLQLNTSQRSAAAAAMDRRLTLVQVRRG